MQRCGSKLGYQRGLWVAHERWGCKRMIVLKEEQLPWSVVPRITTRVHAQAALGTRQTTLWEQRIEPGGFIPIHYHDTEEVITVLEGAITLNDGESHRTLHAPATLLIPANELHGIEVYGKDQVHLVAAFPTATPRIFDVNGNPRPLPQNDLETTRNELERDEPHDE